MAAERGANWALPKNQQGRSVALNRAIRVECHADRLIVLPETSEQVAKEIPLSGATSGSIDALVEAIHQRADAWGIAGAGLHWKPTLVVYVSRGGADRAQDLTKLLDGSGLALEMHSESQAAGPR
jgi:hypothetical protein